MAANAKGLLNISNTLLLSKLGIFLEHSINISRPLLCYQQIRGKRHMKPRAKNESVPWLVKKSAQPHFTQLTQENKDFLTDAARTHYQNVPSPLREEPWPRNEWTIDTRRAGVLAVKIGVVPQWKKDGSIVMCQLLQIVDNHVIRYTPPDEYQNSMGFLPGYQKDIGSVVVGAMSDHPWKYSKGYHNLFLEAGVPPKKKLTRFFITPDAAIQPGTPLNALHFRVGDYIDCSARTICHGFQGVVKRFGFKGGPASHGNTKFHRRPGSLSSGRKRGMPKGKKLPGIMGGDWRITPGLKIWRINTKYNVLYTSVGVPGPMHGFVRIYDTTGHEKRQKMLLKNDKPIAMPTLYPDDIKEPLPEDIYDDELFELTESSIQFAEET